MKRLSFFLLVLTLLFGCRSRKGQFIQIYDEAIQLQKAFDDLTGELDRNAVEEVILKMGRGAETRWEIDDDPHRIVRSLKAYKSFEEPANGARYYYSIDADLGLDLFEATDPSTFAE